MREKKSPKGRNLSKIPIETISGVYFGENRFLRVVEQPNNKPGFVSSISNTATNFQLANRHGNIGLIAHNYLGGRFFHELRPGDEMYVMDGHGRRKNYQVREILKYQAIDPHSTRSDFIDLESKQVCTASDVFKRVYTGKHRLVLQTCIRKGRNAEWGRMFVIGQPIG
jgi:hypothetical protein